MAATSYLATGEVAGELLQRNVLEEGMGEGQRGKASEDEVVDKGVETLQTVELSQFLKVQIGLLIHLPLQVLAAEIHCLPHLNNTKFMKVMFFLINK